MKYWPRYLPDAITLLRPALACVFVALLPGRFRGDIGSTVPLLLFAAICLSDFMDGRLARGLGTVSKTGACLDLYSDFFYITASLVTLNALGQVPLWFTAIVFLKFIEYLITSRILHRGDGAFVPDPLGRIAAGLFFIIPGLVCALNGVVGGSLVVNCALYLAVAFALFSSTIRCISGIKSVEQRIRNETDLSPTIHSSISKEEMRYYL